MSSRSILVALSGSQQAHYAAEVAWLISKKLEADVSAEHIIDSRTVWEMLRNDTPGVLGSAEYMQVFEDVMYSLRALGDKLAHRYEAYAAGVGIRSRCVVKEGNPIEELSADSADYDLLVIGHVPSGMRTVDRTVGDYIRHSIAEGVSHGSKVPVLVVQSRPTRWESMTIVSEVDHINYSYIRSCIKLAKLLGLKPSLEFWGTGTREESPDNLRKNLATEIPEIGDATVEIEYFAGHTVEKRKDLFHGEDITQVAMLPSETLFVLPTRGIARERMTVFGIEPEAFIRNLMLPCLLFWPEDNASFNLIEGTGKVSKQMSAGKR